MRGSTDIRSFLIKPKKVVAAELKAKRREALVATESAFDELLQPLALAAGAGRAAVARRRTASASDEEDDSLVFQSPPPPEVARGASFDETAADPNSPALEYNPLHPGGTFAAASAAPQRTSLFDVHTEVICEDAFEQELRDSEAGA